MGRKCFVPNCRSGCKSSAEKVLFFKAPSDPERLKAWADAIGRKDRELRTVDYLCEKHFTEDMIGKRRYYSELGGIVLLDVPRKPVLLPEATPCIFPEVSSLESGKRAPAAVSAHDSDAAKRPKHDSSVRDLLLGRDSGDELSGSATASNSSPPRSTECNNKTSEPPRPLKIYLPRRSRSRIPSQSSVVAGEGSDLPRSRETDFPTHSSTQSPECSNAVKSEYSTEPSCEGCVPATPVEASFRAEWNCGTAVVKSEPPTDPSAEFESIPPAASNFHSEWSCETSVWLNRIKSEPSVEPSSEECVPATLVASTSPLEARCQSSVHSDVIKSEPSMESSSDDRVDATLTETDIPVEPSCQASACSGVVTGELPSGPNEESATTLPASQKNLPQENEQTYKVTEERQVVLPSSAWLHQDISVKGVESLCFVELRKMSPTSPVLVFKSLELEVAADGLKVTKSVLGRTVASAVIQVMPPMRYASHVSDELRSFDKEAVCRGGPAGRTYPNVRLRCASIDTNGFWRHNKCALCVDSGEGQCAHCRSLSNTLRVHTARKKKQEERKHALLLLRKSNRRKLKTLCRQREAWQRDKLWLEDRIRELHSELAVSWQKVQSLSSDEIFDVVKAADIPETYRVLLSECLAATNATSKNSRRYSEKWMELCTRLHKQTPSGYRFLRETNTLPLPSTKTLNKSARERLTDGAERESASGGS